MEILLTTHGNFAKGILESYHMIAGENKHIHVLCLDEKGIGDYQERLNAWIKAFQHHDLLVLCDLKGGTPFNETYSHYLSKQANLRLIAGLNLPMLLEVGLQLSANLSLDDYATLAYHTGRDEVYLMVDEVETDTIEF